MMPAGRVMPIALISCYPLFIHLAVHFEEPVFRAPAVFLLAAGILYKRLIKPEAAAWAMLAAVGLVTAAVALAGPAKYLFYLPPVVLPALIGWGFARSLLPGRTPLVTAIGERVRGELDPPMRRYTKAVTGVWAVLLAAMATWSALLPWLAGDWVWSVVTNFINYVLIGVLFIGEFLLRKLRFKNHEHPGFKDYLSIVFGSGGVTGRS